MLTGEVSLTLWTATGRVAEAVQGGVEGEGMKKPDGMNPPGSGPFPAAGIQALRSLSSVALSSRTAVEVSQIARFFSKTILFCPDWVTKGPPVHPEAISLCRTIVCRVDPMVHPGRVDRVDPTFCDGPPCKPFHSNVLPC